VERDDPLALIAEDRNIAISPSTCIKTLADTTSQTSAHLVGVVLAVELTHESAKPNQYRIDHAFVDGSYFDTKEREPLVNTGEVFHIARETIEGFDDYDVE
jgi:hypothetical protein